jgi:flagellar basal-body rod protein FlgB
MSQSLGILTALKARMQWHQTRQKLLAENVANADTPKFKPNDLRNFADTLSGQGHTGLVQTQIRHLPALDNGSGSIPGQKGRKFETVPSGNAVNLEDEMMKVAENQMEFQTAITLYQRSLGYLRTAIGRR